MESDVAQQARFAAVQGVEAAQGVVTALEEQIHELMTQKIKADLALQRARYEHARACSDVAMVEDKWAEAVEKVAQVRSS